MLAEYDGHWRVVLYPNKHYKWSSDIELVYDLFLDDMNLHRLN